MARLALEICEDIKRIDEQRAALAIERGRLDNELFDVTGKGFEEFIDGMRRLFDGGMTISVGGGEPMTPNEFLDREAGR